MYRDRVVIAAGPYRAEHARLGGQNEASCASEPRAALMAAVNGKRGRLYLKCQQLLELGEDAEKILTGLAHSRPRRWPRDVERLHELLLACGADALGAGFQRAARMAEVSFAAILREVTDAAFDGLQEDRQ